MPVSSLERETAASESEREARIFGQDLRRARLALDLSVPALAQEADVTRTFVHDVEAGRRFANSALVAALVNHAPDGFGDLYARFKDLHRKRAWRAKRPGAVLARDIAVELNAGFKPGDDAQANDEPPGGTPGKAVELPDQLTSYDDTSPCLQIAIQLLDAAAVSPRQKTLVVSRPPDEFIANAKFQKALARAVATGWTTTRIVDTSVDQAGQRALISEGLRFVGLGHYRVVSSDPRVPTPSFIVAEGVGALQLLSATSDVDSALFFPSAGPTDTVAEMLISLCRRLEQEASPFLTVYETIEKSDPIGSHTARGKPDRPQPTKIRFNRDLAEAEGRAGDRVLVKSGPIVATMPPAIAERQAARWKSHVSQAECALIDILMEDRRRRWSAVRSKSGRVSRDICTKTAIENYLHPERRHVTPASSRESSWAYQSDPFYSGKFLEREDRIAHMRSVIDLIRSQAYDYSLGLADSPDSLASPVGHSYWEVADDTLFVLSFYATDPPVPVYLSIGAPEIVKAFRELADLVWDELPDSGRDQDAVADWIEEQVEAASQAT